MSTSAERLRGKQEWQTPRLVDLLKIERVTEGIVRNPPTGKNPGDSEFQQTQHAGDGSGTRVSYFSAPLTTQGISIANYDHRLLKITLQTEGYSKYMYGHYRMPE